MDLIRSHLGIHSITMSSLECQSVVLHLQQTLMNQGVCLGERILIEADPAQSELYTLLLTTAAASMGVSVVLPSEQGFICLERIARCDSCLFALDSKRV